MADIRKLISQLASQEKLLSDTEFLAPCVGGGKVRTRVANIVYILTPKPVNFQGWGIFQAINNQEAEVIDEPSLPQIMAYLNLFKPLRLRLAYHLQGQTWLAYPINESDMQQRLQIIQPVPIHLVTESSVFETIIAYYDGAAWWFAEGDRRSDIEVKIQLEEALMAEIAPENLRFAGMTPEMATTYNLAWQQTNAGQQRQQALQTVKSRKEKKNSKRRQNNSLEPQEILEKALYQGGGQLQNYSDRGEYWLVEWQTTDGESHTSAINKTDLTVISSGICLSGKDQDFDIQSLVGVIEKRY